jgi:hypothetical protein
MRQRYWADKATQISNRRKLDALASEIKQAVPGCELASDQPYRIADLAIDFCEDVDRLSDADIEHIVTLFQAAGATAKVSSIHVNGWFGQYDKLTMTRYLFEEVYRQSIDALQDNIVFIGDSPNDAPMFEYFNLSVGVANVNEHLHRLASKPKYVCVGRGGAGFAEMVQRLC